MSIVSITYRCDWPGCGREEELGADQLSLDLSQWRRRISDKTHHLCTEHKDKMWWELDKALVMMKRGCDVSQRR